MENPLIFLVLKAYKVSKTLKYLSDPHFQNLHVKIYKKFFYLTTISPLFTAVGSGEECAWLQSATVATVRYGVQHLTVGTKVNHSTYFDQIMYSDNKIRTRRYKFQLHWSKEIKVSC